MSTDEQPLFEIPVVLSQKYKDQLHLVQYPLRPPGRPYDDVGPLDNVAYKHNAKSLDLQYRFERRNPHYNRSAEHQISHLTIVTEPTPQQTNYAMMQMVGDTAVIYPLSSIQHGKPNLDHIDILQSDYDKDVAPVNDEDDTFKSNQLRLRRPDRQGIKRITYDSLTQPKIEEPAQPCLFQHVKAYEYLPNGRSTPHQTTSSTNQQHSLPLDIEDLKQQRPNIRANPLHVFPAVSTSQPIVDGMPCHTARHHDDVNSPFGGGNDDSLLQLKKDLLQTLQFAQVIPFFLLCQSLGATSHERASQVLKILPLFAHLIHGVWVIQSKFLYNIKTVPRDRVLFTARNYLLCKFHGATILDQSHDIDPILALLTLHELKTMLQDIARRPNPDSRSWMFLYPPDEQFIRKFPNIVHASDDAMQQLWVSTETLLTPSALAAQTTSQSSVDDEIIPIKME